MLLSLSFFPSPVPFLRNSGSRGKVIARCKLDRMTGHPAETESNPANARDRNRDPIIIPKGPPPQPRADSSPCLLPPPPSLLNRFDPRRVQRSTPPLQPHSRLFHPLFQTPTSLFPSFQRQTSGESSLVINRPPTIAINDSPKTFVFRAERRREYRRRGSFRLLSIGSV